MAKKFIFNPLTGNLDVSDGLSDADFIEVYEGTAGADKIVRTNASGKIDDSLVNAGSGGGGGNSFFPSGW